MLPRAPRQIAKVTVRIIRARRYALRRRLLRIHGVDVYADVRLDGAVKVHRVKHSSMRIEKGVALNASRRKNTLEARGPVILTTFRPSAQIVIGKDTGITSSTLSAGTSIIIGERVLIGSGVIITDSDHHPLTNTQGQPRRFSGLPDKEMDRPVVIGNDVFVGARTMILKGVSIGEGSVIGAGSVVTSDIPRNVIAAGVPCRVQRNI